MVARWNGASMVAPLQPSNLQSITIQGNGWSFMCQLSATGSAVCSGGWTLYLWMNRSAMASSMFISEKPVVATPWVVNVIFSPGTGASGDKVMFWILMLPPQSVHVAVMTAWDGAARKWWSQQVSQGSTQPRFSPALHLPGDSTSITMAMTIAAPMRCLVTRAMIVSLLACLWLNGWKKLCWFESL